MRNVNIEIAFYDEFAIADKIANFSTYSFESIEEAIATLEFMKMGYQFFKDGKGLAVRIEQGSQIYLIDVESTIPLITLESDLRKIYSETNNLNTKDDENIVFKTKENQTANSNFYFEEDANTKYAKTSTGEKLPFKLYNTINSETRPNLLRESGDTERSTDFALIERRFTENNVLKFYGNEKIENHNDVAWLFKSLEDEAVEHAFLVYHFENKGYFVQHISTGSYDQAIVDNKLLIGNILQANPKSVTLVHNHPSGNLKASKADFQCIEHLQKALQNSDVEVNPGVIINLRSGKYLVFADDTSVNQIKHRSSNAQAFQEIQPYSFSKQVMVENYQPHVVTSSAQVASFISTQKFGISDKTEMLILNNQLNIVGKFIMPPQNRVDFIIGKVTQFGGSNCIIYGNNITPEEINLYNDRLKYSRISITDGILFKSENGAKIYQSFIDDGLLNREQIESDILGATKEPSINYESQKYLSHEDILLLIPEERVGDNFHIKVSKEEAEYLITNDLISDIMNKEYGDDADWVGMTKDDFDEETNKFDDDYQTFEIHAHPITKEQLEGLLNEIKSFSKQNIEVFEATTQEIGIQNKINNKNNLNMANPTDNTENLITVIPSTPQQRKSHSESVEYYDRGGSSWKSIPLNIEQLKSIPDSVNGIIISKSELLDLNSGNEGQGDFDRESHILNEKYINDNNLYTIHINLTKNNNIKIAKIYWDEAIKDLASETIFATVENSLFLNNNNLIYNNQNQPQMEAKDNNTNELTVGKLATVKFNEGMFKGTIESISADKEMITLVNLEGKKFEAKEEFVYQFFNGQKYDISEIEKLFDVKPAGLEFKDIKKEDLTRLLRGEITNSIYKGVSSKSGAEGKEYEFKVRPEYNSEHKRLDLKPYFKNANEIDLSTTKVFGKELTSEEQISLQEGKLTTIDRANQNGKEYTAKVHLDTDLNQIIFDKFVNKTETTQEQTQGLPKPSFKDKFEDKFAYETFLRNEVTMFDNATKANQVQLDKVFLALDLGELSEFLTDFSIESTKIDAILDFKDLIKSDDTLDNLKSSVLQEINSSSEKVDLFKEKFATLGQDQSHSLKK